jgi:hypothetical protein
MEYPPADDVPDIVKIIGVGNRLHKPTGEIRPVVDFFYSYFNRMSEVFENTPVAKVFGISIVDALGMPVNRWHDIARQAKIIANRPTEPSEESKMVDLMREFIGALTPRGDAD